MVEGAVGVGGCRRSVPAPRPSPPPPTPECSTLRRAASPDGPVLDGEGNSAVCNLQPPWCIGLVLSWIAQPVADRVVAEPPDLFLSMTLARFGTDSTR